MQDVAKKYSDQLEDMKEKVKDWQQYFQSNNERYHRFINFVYKSSISEDEADILEELNKPAVEFNILESIVNRILGDFADHQPSITTRAKDGTPSEIIDEKFVSLLKLLESFFRAALSDSGNDNVQYKTMIDTLSGGYSVFKIYTEYESPTSFEQILKFKRVHDPTLCGFDPIATDTDKGDGDYCFEIIPMTKENFCSKYGDDATQDMYFSSKLEGFEWSYRNGSQDIVLVCDFYKKIKKKEKICKLSNGKTIKKKNYDSLKNEWKSVGIIEQLPTILKERYTEFTSIEQIRFCGDKVLERSETSFEDLPLIFVDGNSQTIKENGIVQQMTKPYVYHAVGTQKLKNCAGQALAHELEAMTQTTWRAAIESIPDQVEYQEAYTNPQRATVLLYNHFLDKTNPEVTLPPPDPVQKKPIPPQISETFRMTDDMTMLLLGSFDAANAMRNGPSSGIAFARSSMLGNKAAVPYIESYMNALNSLANAMLKLIPKYYRTKRTIPTMDDSGKRNYVEVNNKESIESIFLQYDPDTLQIKVEAGVNFAMQREIAMQNIVQLMNASPLFSEFMGSEGLGALLDNVDFRGIEDLKLKAEQFMKNKKEQQDKSENLQQQRVEMEMQEAQKKLNSPTKEQIDMMKLQKTTQLEAANLQQKTQKDAADISVKQQNAETQFLELMSKVQAQDIDHELKAAEIEAENTRSAVEQNIQVSKHLNDVFSGMQQSTSYASDKKQ